VSDGVGPAGVNGSAPPTVSQEAVTVSLSIGWLLAELLPRPESAEQATEDPARSLLLTTPPPSLRVRQVQTKLAALRPHLQAVGRADAQTARLKRLARVSEVDPLHHSDVMTLVGELSGDLSAASTRLGKAFGLGFDLANTCQLPQDATQHEFEDRFGSRVVGIQEALADLSSALPEHAARGVSLSLALWQAWAEKQQLSNRRVQWPHDGVQDALARQGEVWRSVLAGEKLAEDVLDVNDYLGALRTLAARLLLSRRWVMLLLVVTIVATGAGVYLLIAQPGLLSKIGGVALSVLGALGISTATVKRTFSSVAGQLERELWGAELDAAIAEAIVVPPGDWEMNLNKIDLPPARGSDPSIASNARIVHRLATTISQRGRPRWLRMRVLGDLLHDQFELRPTDGPTIPGQAARQQLLATAYLGNDPTQLRGGAPGRLASQHPDADGEKRAAVWTFHHGKLYRLEESPSYADARTTALTPWLGSDSGVQRAINPGRPAANGSDRSANGADSVGSAGDPRRLM
jgi:hypothetical protein